MISDTAVATRTRLDRGRAASARRPRVPRQRRTLRRLLATSCLLAVVRSGGALFAAAPVVDSLGATPSVVAPGASALIALAAHDPDCAGGNCTTGCGQTIRADLTSWSASSGQLGTPDNGVTGSPYAASVAWQAPESEGEATITVSVSDSGTFLCGGRQTTTTQLLVTVSSQQGTPPKIDLLTASPASVLPGASAELICLASDPDGDTPVLGWRVDRGTVEEVSASEARFVAPADVGPATVTCTATDADGLRAESSIEVAVSGALAERSLETGLASPRRLALDAQGSLLVVDPRAAAIVAFDLGSGEPIERIAAPGVSSIAVDGEGRLLVGGAHGAELRARDGTPLRALGGPGDGPVADVAVDRGRSLYGVLYRNAGRVAVYDADGGLLLVFGNDDQGAGPLAAPLGLAVSEAGDWLVADTGHGVVRVFDAQGVLLRTIGAPGGQAGEFIQLDAVAVDAAGRIYASDSYQDWVQIFESDGVLREVVGQFGDGLGGLRNAAGLALAEPLGWLFVASQNGGAVRLFRLALDSEAPPRASAELTPATLDFGARELGSATVPLVATLRNLGGGALGVRELRAGPGFELDSACPATLAPGAACALEVAFVPDRLGPYAETLSVVTSASPAPLAVALNGTAFGASQLVLTPRRLEYAEQPVGTVSASKPVAAINAGGLPLALAATELAGDFALVDACGPTLAPGASCQLSVFFSPQSEGDPLLGSLTVTPSPGAPDQVALAGRSVLLRVEARPRNLFFVPFRLELVQAPETVTITNSGSATVRVGPATLEGDGASSFVVERSDCAGELAPGSSCSIDLRFAPDAPGAVEAELRLGVERIDDLRVGLTGGIEALFADGFESGDARDWSVGTVDFGACVRGGDCFVTLLWPNDGPRDLALGALEWPDPGAGPFWIASESCSSRLLELFQTCSIELGFTPPHPGQFSARLRIRLADGTGLWRDLELSGEGVPQ